MKTIKLIFVIMLATFISDATAQSHKEIIKKELSFSNPKKTNAFVVDNVFGSIEVEGYSGDKIIIEVEKYIDAYHKDDLERGKKEIGVNVIEKEDSIVVYLDSPFTYIDEKQGRIWFKNNYNYSRNNDYKFELNYKIKVPSNTNIALRTVNDGNIKAKNMKGEKINVSNVNGSISLINVSGQTKAHTVNGEVYVTYQKNPSRRSSYKSINGDIEVKYLKGLSADISFESMNGDFYTDFDVDELAPKTTKKESRGRMGVKYKLEYKPTARIGKGGVDFNFETLNGDVIVRKL